VVSKHIVQNGIRQKCTEVKWVQSVRIMCFDDSNGTLVGVEFPRQENQKLFRISRIEYGEFKPTGEKLFPWEIWALRDKDVVAAVKVLAIEKVADESSALFSPPGGTDGSTSRVTVIQKSYPNWTLRPSRQSVTGVISQRSVDRNWFAPRLKYRSSFRIARSMQLVRTFP
jgi:hypothetical protein